MTDSATSPRERRIAETSRGLRDEARRLALTRGMTGFTVDEVCAEVGVSRRTFFNYFASKENAVLGLPMREDSSDLDEAFVASTAPRDELINDLAELMVSRWARMHFTKDEADEVAAIFEREPQLFSHLMHLIEQGERADIALIERREGFDGGDLRAATAVHVLGSLIRPSVTEYFAEGDDDFRAIFLRRVAVARALLAV